MRSQARRRDMDTSSSASTSLSASTAASTGSTLPSPRTCGIVIKNLADPRSFRLFPDASTMFMDFLKALIGMPMVSTILSDITGQLHPVSHTNGWVVKFSIFEFPLMLPSIVGEAVSFLASFTLPNSASNSSMDFRSMSSWMLPTLGKV